MTSEDKIVSTEWNNTNEMTRTDGLGKASSVFTFPAKSYTILRDFNDNILCLGDRVIDSFSRIEQIT